MWDERAKAAIDRSRNGSTGSAIMAQLLAAANTERGKDARNVGFLWKTKLGWGRIQRINHIARDEPVTYSTLRAYASQ